MGEYVNLVRMILEQTDVDVDLTGHLDHHQKEDLRQKIHKDLAGIASEKKAQYKAKDDVLAAQKEARKKEKDAQDLKDQAMMAAQAQAQQGQQQQPPQLDDQGPNLPQGYTPAPRKKKGEKLPKN